ncbi:uncharacterized protein LMH87_007545 [Akanthomyces muscarius]|uniref:Uncharacterized protein n=1 Tax=Akanthomyces muscarius TaxID=2231603 RepID=A0A9W8QJC7_AKAMU|nr:uncharacterized protein LMH87_007545 [Akanthomyces muscarius]KAJ4161507.1 hypothetical protein LMH87_007545 [Akanthomyces muscarius]
MATSIFCCAALAPYRPQRLMHEDKFNSFFKWAAFPQQSRVESASGTKLRSAGFAVQLVRQVNYGPLESKRYFVPWLENTFAEVDEDELIQANFAKVNTCQRHDKFFELNIYQKDPVNLHHWRANLARPARDIDLQTPRLKSTNGDASSPGTSRSAAFAYSEAGPGIMSAADEKNEHDGTLWQRESFSDRYSPVKDLTACDQECGYCGECDY